jgi:hypothetical protein
MLGRQIIKTLRDLENEFVLSPIIVWGFSVVVTLQVCLSWHCIMKVRSEEMEQSVWQLSLLFTHIPYR